MSNNKNNKPKITRNAMIKKAWGEPKPAQEKFWTYDSGQVIIDEGKLYDFLYNKGYRYFKPTGSNFKFIVRIMNNDVVVYLYDNLRQACLIIMDKEFHSLSDEEKVRVQDAIYESKDILKKKRLVQLTYEDLERLEESESKRFLMGLINNSEAEKGNEI